MNIAQQPPGVEPEFELRPHDLTNPLWRAIERHYIERLAHLRALNDNDLDHVATGRLRGQIAEVKALLSLAQERPAIK